MRPFESLSNTVRPPSLIWKFFTMPYYMYNPASVFYTYLLFSFSNAKLSGMRSSGSFFPLYKHAMYSFNLPYVSILVNNAEKVSLFCHHDLWLVHKKVLHDVSKYMCVPVAKVYKGTTLVINKVQKPILSHAHDTVAFMIQKLTAATFLQCGKIKQKVSFLNNLI